MSLLHILIEVAGFSYTKVATYSHTNAAGDLRIKVATDSHSKYSTTL